MNEAYAVCGLVNETIVCGQLHATTNVYVLKYYATTTYQSTTKYSVLHEVQTFFNAHFGFWARTEVF